MTSDHSPAVDAPPWLGDLLGDPAVWAEPPESLRRAVRSIERRPDGRRRLLSRVVTAATVAAALVFVVAGTHAFRRDDPAPVAALTGTARAARASGALSIRPTPDGVQLELRTRGLAAAPAGSFYEGWVRGPHGGVSIGTFHLRRGNGPVTLWAGVGLADHPAVVITLEPDDGDPRSSGVVVLQGRAPPATPR